MFAMILYTLSYTSAYSSPHPSRFARENLSSSLQPPQLRNKQFNLPDLAKTLFIASKWTMISVRSAHAQLPPKNVSHHEPFWRGRRTTRRRCRRCLSFSTDQPADSTERNSVRIFKTWESTVCVIYPVSIIAADCILACSSSGPCDPSESPETISLRTYSPAVIVSRSSIVPSNGR